MSVRQYSSELWRAYKKINGKEYQEYFSCYDEAQKRQNELDALSNLTPRRVFSTCGRLRGVRISARFRKGRKPAIIARVGIGPFRKQMLAEKRYHGDFEELWSWIKVQWKRGHELMSQDAASYSKELLRAKHLYIQDVVKAEKSLENKVHNRVLN